MVFCQKGHNREPPITSAKIQDADAITRGISEVTSRKMSQEENPVQDPTGPGGRERAGRRQNTVPVTGKVKSKIR